MIGAVSATSDNNNSNLGSDLTGISVKHADNSQMDKTSSTNDMSGGSGGKSSANYAIVNENKDTENRLITNKEDDILKNGETKSFKELNTSIQGNISSGIYEIKLESNYQYMDSDGEELKNGITIKDNKITINGNYHTINGNNIARIFNITGNDVTLKNIIFINGNTTNYGGAIYWYGDNGCIDTCNFTYNYADKGGAIYWGDEDQEPDKADSNKAKNGTITNSKFSYNAAMLGGAIYWFANDGNLINSDFNNNNVEYDGGAIYWNGHEGTIKDNCDFTKNIAEALGGAVYWHGIDGTITNNCNFVNNTAYCEGSDNVELGGGAICWYGDNGAITNNCSFINNNACSDTDSNIILNGGGAVHFMSDNNHVSACIFVNNNASNHGGAIWCRGCVVSNCIFLNNTAGYGDTIYSNTSLKVNYNWFGHNSSNYKKPLPISGSYTYDTCLFLNATSNLDMVTASSTNIAFKLKYYNKTSNKISDYDNNLLYPINLIVSPKLGSVDKEIAHLNDTIIYTAPNIASNDNVTAIIENVEYSINLNIKYPTKFTITVTNSTTDNPINITVTETNHFNGTVTVKINEITCNITLHNGKGTNNTITILNIGKYNATINYPGNDTFNATTSTSNTFLIKHPTKFTITIPNSTTDNITINVTESHGFTGTIILNINGTTCNVTLQDGKGTNNTIKLSKPGNYIATIDYLGNETYNATTATSNTFNIKYPTQFTINNIPDFTEGSSIDLIVNEKNNYTGQVIIILGTETYNMDMVNGTSKLTITPKLTPGTYSATIKFAGDENYTETNTTSNTFKINSKTVPPSPKPTNKQNTKIIAKNKVYKAAKYRTYTVKVKNKNGKLVKNTTVKLKIGKKTYTSKTNNKCVATFKIPNKKSKKTKKSIKKSYKITATLNKNAKKDKLTLQIGSKKYNTKTNNNGKGTFKVKTSKKKIRKYSITLQTTSGEILKEEKVTLRVKGKTFKATTNSKGKAVFKINNLNKNGKYTATIIYQGNKKYKASKKTVKIIIK